MSEKRGLLKKKQALAAEGLEMGDRLDIVDVFELIAMGKGEALKMREISALEGETGVLCAVRERERPKMAPFFLHRGRELIPIIDPNT